MDHHQPSFLFAKGARRWGETVAPIMNDDHVDREPTTMPFNETSTPLGSHARKLKAKDHTA